MIEIMATYTHIICCALCTTLCFPLRVKKTHEGAKNVRLFLGLLAEENNYITTIHKTPDNSIGQNRQQTIRGHF
jgi:hypothetical protein